LVHGTGTGGTTFTAYRANKYATTGETPIVLASAVEARLVQAEAALRAGDASWLMLLNQLRVGPDVVVPPDTIVDTLGMTGCGSTICGDGLPDANSTTGGGNTPDYGQPPGGFPGYTVTDSATIATDDFYLTCWNVSWYLPCYVDVNVPRPGQTKVYILVKPGYTQPGSAGSGGVPGLSELTDPDPSAPLGPTPARVDLLFRERAFWLYLTGHRQGDLRRLIRQYNRDPEDVYPSGLYPVLGNFYGTDVVAPVPSTETLSNPQYTGCASPSA
jgi:hypothetical protein